MVARTGDSKRGLETYMVFPPLAYSKPPCAGVAMLRCLMLVVTAPSTAETLSAT